MRLAVLVVLALVVAGCGARYETEERSLRVTEASRTLKGVLVSVEFQWHRHQPGALEVHALGTARNDGSVSYVVETECGDPWRFWLERGDERLQHEAPKPRCEAFITKPFPPGSSVGTRFDWDRGLWNATTGRSERAPAGDYGLFVAFTFHEPGGRQDSVVMSYPFEVPP